MLKAVELNREVTIAQFQEELDRLRVCVAQRDSLEKELLAHKTDKVMVVPVCVCMVKAVILYSIYDFSLHIFRQIWPVCVSSSVRQRSSFKRPGSRRPCWPRSSATQPVPVTTQ